MRVRIIAGLFLVAALALLALVLRGDPHDQGGPATAEALPKDPKGMPSPSTSTARRAVSLADACGDSVVDEGEECDLGPGMGFGAKSSCTADCRRSGVRGERAALLVKYDSACVAAAGGFARLLAPEPGEPRTYRGSHDGFPVGDEVVPGLPWIEWYVRTSDAAGNPLGSLPRSAQDAFDHDACFAGAEWDYAGAGAPAASPEDPLYPAQWGLHHTGVGSLLTNGHVDLVDLLPGTTQPIQLCGAGTRTGDAGADTGYAEMPASCANLAINVGVIDTGVLRDGGAAGQLPHVYPGASCRVGADLGRGCHPTAFACVADADCCSDKCRNGLCIPAKNLCLKDRVVLGNTWQLGADRDNCPDDGKDIPGPCSAPQPSMSQAGNHAGEGNDFGVWDMGTHGTRVASIIAAKHDGRGMAGVGQNINIVPVKVFGGGDDDRSSASSADLARSIMWLLSNDNANPVKVINISGAWTPSGLIKDAGNVAIRDHDVWIVASAGNDPVADCSRDEEHPAHLCAPASYSGVIAVGMTNNQDRLGQWDPAGSPTAYIADGGFVCDGNTAAYDDAWDGSQRYPQLFTVAPGQDIVTLAPRAFFKRCHTPSASSSFNGKPCRQSADCGAGGTCSELECPTGFEVTEWCAPDPGSAGALSAWPAASGAACHAYCMRPCDHPVDGHAAPCWSTLLSDYPRNFFAVKPGRAPDGTPWSPAPGNPRSLASELLMPTSASGTSFSAPFVTAYVALYRAAHPGATLKQAKEAIAGASRRMTCATPRVDGGRFPCTDDSQCDASSACGPQGRCQDLTCTGKCGLTAEEQMSCFGVGMIDAGALFPAACR